MASPDCIVGDFSAIDDTLLVTGMVLVPATIEQSGSKVPAIGATWDPINNTYAIGVEFQVTPTGSDSTMQTFDYPKASGAAPGILISPGMAPNKSYAVRWRVYGGDASGPWSDYVDVFSGAYLISTDTMKFGDLDADEVASKLAAITALEQHVTAISGMADADIGAYLTLNDNNIAEALRQVSVSANAIIKGALNFGAFKAYVDALTYIAGQPMGPVVEQTVTTAADSAQSLDLLAIKSPTGDSIALRTTTVTRESDGSTLDSVFIALTTADANAAAANLSEQIARTTADGALSASLITLTANYGSLSATVVSNASASASATAAVATSVNGLTANFGSLSASVLANATAIATATGQLYGSYTLQVQAGNVVTGLELLAASGKTEISSIILRADFFKIEAEGYPSVQPFFYDATTGSLFTDTIIVRNGNIQDLSVDHLKILGGSVSFTDVVSNAGPFTSGGLILSITFQVPDGESATVYSLFTAKQDYESIPPCPWSATIDIDSSPINSTGGGVGYTDSLALGATELAVGPGWHTVEAFWSPGNANLYLDGAVLFVLVIFK